MGIFLKKLIQTVRFNNDLSCKLSQSFVIYILFKWRKQILKENNLTKNIFPSLRSFMF